MKFMKLGSKPDLFQSNGENIRFVATELATDIIVNVGNVKFYLHKFPLLSKSARLQKVVAISNDENSDEIQIHDIPGGPAAFEICAKFCYGMTVTLNAYNVVSARCAAEYLEMYETMDKGNLIYKIEVFLNSSIFRTWKDSIIVFQTTKSLLHWSEELKVVSHCIDSIATKASIETSKVEWSYTYNRKKLPSENGSDSPHYNGVRKQLMVPKDWWVEDLCDLPSDLYKRVITTIKTKGKVSPDVIGESVRAYAQRRLPWLGKKGSIEGGDDLKSRYLVETIVSLLPTEKNSVSSDFLLQLLQASILLDCGETRKKELMRRIGQQLPNASVADIVILDVDMVQELVKIFMTQDWDADHVDYLAENEFLDVKRVDAAAKAKVAKLVDGYLAEIAKDPNLELSKFADLADMVATLPRQSHDGIYRAIDMYLKEHPGVSKSERKRICRLMDCRKLSADACMHAVQNERLPLRVVVQVLFFEQIRATTTGSGGGVPPDLSGPVRALLPANSHGSSQSATTNTEEEWDSVPTSEELKALKGELASLRLRDGGSNSGSKTNNNKLKGMVMSRRLFSKLFSSKDRDSDNGSSDTSESPCSTNAEETKSSTPSRSRRHSLS